MRHERDRRDRRNRRNTRKNEKKQEKTRNRKKQIKGENWIGYVSIALIVKMAIPPSPGREI